MRIAAVLAGGLGTRLRAVLGARQKVVAQVGGRPFLAQIVEQLEAAGEDRVVVCTGYHAAEVEQALGARHFRIEIVYSEEVVPLGTAGALALARPSFSEAKGAVLVLNGDSYCEVDLARLREWQATDPSAASIVVARVEEAARYGAVRVEGERVLAFEEKGQAGPALVNAGVYALPPRVLAALPVGEPVSLERDVLPRLLPTRLRAFRETAGFHDIGTPEALAAADASIEALRRRSA